MAMVIDSSVAACWVMPDEFSEIANRALEIVSSEGMLVPSLFWYELGNVLLVNERRKRISVAQVEQGLAKIRQIPCNIDAGSADESLFRVARDHTLTIYDAAYLEVALRAQSTIATLDRRLGTAARAAGVTAISLET